ncbi:hypothetical protein BGZ73_000825 [Actinomortierella ambigua]|nr:hypothetical protein BGZ73_000825 [Actinomortierella ambigua]
MADIQLTLHAYIHDASLAADPVAQSKHLDAFTQEWRKEPSLEQFDSALALVRDARQLGSENLYVVTNWFLGYLQDIALESSVHHDTHQLAQVLLKSTKVLDDHLQFFDPRLVKRSIQTYAAIYPVVFRLCCQEHLSGPALWNEYGLRLKQTAMRHLPTDKESILLALAKYMQTVIQTQSYKSRIPGPPASEVPFTSTIITGVIAPLSALQRARPQYIPRVLKTLTSFIKNGSLPPQLTPLQIRFIDKAIRIQLVTVSKYAPVVTDSIQFHTGLRLQANTPQQQALTEALALYGITYNGVGLGKGQLHQLLHVDKEGEDSKRTSKRARALNQDTGDVDLKRVKTEPTAAPAPSPTIPPGFGMSLLSQVNISQMPLHHVVDIIFETLGANAPPQLFRSFMTALPTLPHQPGPLPPPPPGVTLPPPLPPPGAVQDLRARSQDKTTPPQTPPSAAQGPPGAPQIKREPGIKQEPVQQRGPPAPPAGGPPAGRQIKVIVLPPQHTPVRLPPRPMIAKSDAVVLAARKKEPSEEVKEEPEMTQQQRKRETFQVAPFVPTGRETNVADRSPLRDVLEMTFMRILAAEKFVTVPAATGRNFFEAAATSGRLSLPTTTAAQGEEGTDAALVPFASSSSSEKESQSKVITKADWMTMTSRLLTRAFNRKSDDGPSSTSAVSGHRKSEHLKEMMVKYICSDFRKYRELALTWLHEEWYFDKENLQKMEAGDPSVPADWEPQYLWCLYKLLDGIISGTTGTDAPRDRGFIRFLLEVPELPDDAVDMIKRYCEEPPRMQLGFMCLRDIINLRPPSRAHAMRTLLSYTPNSDKGLRSLSIMTARRWYMEHDTLGPVVEAHAVAQLDALRHFEVPKRDHAALAPVQAEAAEKEGAATTKTSDGTDVKMEDVTLDKPIKREGSLEPRPPGVDGTSAGTGAGTTAPAPTRMVIDDKFAAKVVKAEEDIGNQLEFYFSLCAKNNGLLVEVLRRYQSMDSFVQRVIRQKIVPLIKWVKSDSPKLLALIKDFPAGAENLILRIIHITTEAGRASRGLVMAVQETVVSHDLNARFLVPIVSGMQKDELIACLPRIVNLLKGGAERDRKMVEEVFLSLLAGSKGRPAAAGTAQPAGPGRTQSQQPQQPSRPGVAGSATGASAGQAGQSNASAAGQFGPLLTPSELLIELHKMENVVGWKIACEAMDICFAHPEIYRSEVLAVILQQLLDQPSIPALFMRTVIQAITMYKNLVGFANSMVLSPLVQKKIWTVPVLWKGFIRCARLMSPTSSSVLATLPKPQLKDVYAAEPSLREPVEAYVKARSSGRRVGGGVTKQLNLHHVAAPAASSAPVSAASADDTKPTDRSGEEGVDGSNTEEEERAKKIKTEETGGHANVNGWTDAENDLQSGMDVDHAPPRAEAEATTHRIDVARDGEVQQQQEEEDERIENVGA